MSARKWQTVSVRRTVVIVLDVAALLERVSQDSLSLGTRRATSPAYSWAIDVVAPLADCPWLA